MRTVVVTAVGTGMLIKRVRERFLRIASKFTLHSRRIIFIVANDVRERWDSVWRRIESPSEMFANHFWLVTSWTEAEKPAEVLLPHYRQRGTAEGTFGELFNLYDGGKRFNSNDIINFLKQMLAHHKSRHLVVVMDQASCHKSKVTKDFIESQKRLHVFYLPPRSPEFNPDEHVCAHLKNHDLKSHQQTNQKGLKNLARKKLRCLSKDRNKVRGIFKRCENAALFCEICNYFYVTIYITLTLTAIPTFKSLEHSKSRFSK